MSDEKFILISMDNDRAKKIAEVLGNNTCKKIIDHLASVDEASVKDVSDALKIPINTAEYNIKNLLSSELIRKRKNFFWSKKGKKIMMYELSKKSIVISPKGSDVSSKLKSLFPAVMISAVGAFAAYVFTTVKQGGKSFAATSEKMLYDAGGVMEVASEGINRIPQDLLYSPPSPAWVWFLGGALVALMVVSIVNWSKL